MNQAGPILALCAVLTLLEGRADADLPPCVCDAKAPANPALSLSVTKDAAGRCAGFDLKGPGVAQRFRGEMGNGVVATGPDGDVVFFVQTRAQAKVVHGSVRNALDGRPDGKAVGLVFYKGGKAIAAYSMDEILVRPWLVSSVPFWIEWLTNVNPSGRELVVKTTSLREAVFDVRTGALVKSQDLPKWQKCDTLVYGTLKADRKGFFFEKPEIIKGAGGRASPRARLDVAGETVEGRPLDKRVGDRNLFCVEGARGGPAQIAEKYDDASFESLPFNVPADHD